MIQTTTIGSYPRPDGLKLPNWFREEGHLAVTQAWPRAVEAYGSSLESVIAEHVRRVIGEQVSAGIAVVTDGEVYRENYIHYQCRHLHGIDFELLTSKVMRSGSYKARVPTIVGGVSVRSNCLLRDWKRAQAMTDRPVKVTLPGPMTIYDTLADHFYGDPIAAGADLARAINEEVRALSVSGCRHIQIDEPLFAREPEAALAYGIEHVEAAFAGCLPTTERIVHICCGYPDRLDNPDFPKASPRAYFELAGRLDCSAFDVVALEDCHRRNDLALLDEFKTKKIILGSVDVTTTAVESAEFIRSRICEVLEHLGTERLAIAPDCGLGLLPWDVARRKLQTMVEAGRGIR